MQLHSPNSLPYRQVEKLFKWKVDIIRAHFDQSCTALCQFTGSDAHIRMVTNAHATTFHSHRGVGSSEDYSDDPTHPHAKTSQEGECACCTLASTGQTENQRE